MPRRPSSGAGAPSSGASQPGNKAVDRKPASTSGAPDNARLAAMIESGKKRLGNGYQGGYNGAQPVGHPVSCSDLIDSMRRDAGLPPYCAPGGTYTAYNKLSGSGAGSGFGGRYDPNFDYQAGTLIVARGGQGGPDGTHMAMFVGGGQVIESITPGGPRITKKPGSFPAAGQAIVGIMPDVGTEAFSAPGEVAGDVAGAAGDVLGSLTEGITNGLLKGLLAVAGFIYGYLILRLLDFWGGFWWEFTSKLLGEMAPWLEDVDLIKIATGQEDAPAMPPVTGSSGAGIALDDEALNRLFFVLFVIFSYQLAWGRDTDGNYRMDRALGGLGQLSNVDLRSKKAKNTRATLEAEVVSELVGAGYSPERARTAAKKELKAMDDKELREEARRRIARLRAEKMPRDENTRKFQVLEGGKKKELKRSIEDETIEALVKQGVPRERAERSVRKGNVREV